MAQYPSCSLTWRLWILSGAGCRCGAGRGCSRCRSSRDERYRAVPHGYPANWAPNAGWLRLILAGAAVARGLCKAEFLFTSLHCLTTLRTQKREKKLQTVPANLWEEAPVKFSLAGRHQLSASQLPVDPLRALLSFLLRFHESPPCFSCGDQQQSRCRSAQFACIQLKCPVLHPALVPGTQREGKCLPRPCNPKPWSMLGTAKCFRELGCPIIFLLCKQRFPEA